FANNELRCWGRNNEGQLGDGNNQAIGDNEHPVSASVVDLGVDVGAAAIAAGGDHSCAITTNFELLCWGENGRGQLGFGHTNGISKNDPPSVTGTVDVHSEDLPGDAKLIQVSLGREHSCALFSSGDVLCWGENGKGQLGQGNDIDFGDDNGEVPADLSPISLGGVPVTAISAGANHN